MKLKNILSNFSIALLVSSTAWSMEDDTFHYTFGNSSVSFKEGQFKVSQQDSTFFTKPHETTTPSPQSTLRYQNIPREEEVLKRIISGEDGRKRIKQTTEWPHRIHGQLTMTYKDEFGEYGGSGILVGPHHVLTAGHCIYNFKKKKWKETISVFFGLNKKSAPFGEQKVVKAYTYSQWVNEGDKRYDIALLVLDHSIGDEIGWCGLLCLDDNGISKETVTITGYPGDKDHVKMMTMSHKVKTIKPEELYYDIDTYPGQSGSGIWINKWESPYVIGVHAYGEGLLYTGNSGVRLSPSKFKRIIGWISQSLTLDKDDQQFPKSPSIPINKGLLLFEQHWSLGLQEKLSKAFINKIKEVYEKGLTRLNQQKSKLDDSVAQALAKNKTLTWLGLDVNNIGNVGAQALAQNTTLTYLNLGLNKISDEGAKALAKNTTLTVLYLWKNKLGDTGAQALAQNTTLKRLSLRSNNISDVGAQALAKNTTLKELTIWGNKIGDEGAKSFAQNETVTTLDLSKNRISDEGARYFLENTTLTHLVLTDNNISEKIMTLINQRLELNKKN